MTEEASDEWTVEELREVLFDVSDELRATRGLVGHVVGAMRELAANDCGPRARRVREVEALERSLVRDALDGTSSHYEVPGEALEPVRGALLESARTVQASGMLPTRQRITRFALLILVMRLNGELAEILG